MTRTAHDEARELLALGRAEDLSQPQQTWLRDHLQQCAACGAYADAAARAVRALRSIPLAAGTSLVRATQLRVRQRALELHRQQERLWIVSVCCAAVALAATSSTAVLWRGFLWIGREVQLPGPLWQIGLVVLGLIPAVGAAILLLANGVYLADHNGTLHD